METTQGNPELGVQSPVRRSSRVKAAVAAIIVAGALSALGAASVFAAGPTPSPGASSGTTTHTCPAHAGSSSSN